MNEAVEVLEKRYRRIGAERMRTLPVYNQRLSVEALGFRPWQGRPTGILITPWCMNLLILPAVDDQWADLAPGETSEWDFPSGKYEFTACVIDELPAHLSAALFSSVQDFPDQETARAVAEEILVQLFSEGDADSLPGDDDSGDTSRTGRPVSRRSLLRSLVLMDD